MTSNERSTILFLLFSVKIIFVASDCSTFDKYFYIQHRASGLVLHSQGPSVSLERYEDSIYVEQYQQWRFLLAPRTGLFILHIKYSIGALDFDKDTYEIVRNDENDSIYQQWFLNADGTIVNGALYGYGLTVNRTEFDENDVLFMAPIEKVGEEHIFTVIDADNFVKKMFSL